MNLEEFLPNRAVTPWFRAFGGREAMPPGERLRAGGYPGGHAGECLALGLLFPSLAAVAVLDSLWRLGGAWLALPAFLPATFLLLHALAFGLRVRTPWMAVAAWSLLASGWALWMIARGGDTPLRWAAWGWWAAVALQLPALAVLAWKRLMRVPGPAGVRLRIGLAWLMPAVWGLLLWRHGPGAAFGFGNTIATLWALGTFPPASPIFGPAARRVRSDDVWLSFDDGPHPEHTPALLDLLDRHGRKAVFFVVGDRVREFPDLARAIVARGHELGNHTMTHPQGTMWRLGPRRTLREIEDCQRVIEEVTGVRPRWFRSPVGHRGLFVNPIASKLGLEVVAWSRRAFDTVGNDVEMMARRLTRGCRAGDILLLHEGTRTCLGLAARVLELLDTNRDASR